MLEQLTRCERFIGHQESYKWPENRIRPKPGRVQRSARPSPFGQKGLASQNHDGMTSRRLKPPPKLPVPRPSKISSANLRRSECQSLKPRSIVFSTCFSACTRRLERASRSLNVESSSPSTSIFSLIFRTYAIQCPSPSCTARGSRRSRAFYDRNTRIHCWHNHDPVR